MAVRSRLDTLGNRFTTARWSNATADGSFTCASMTYWFGAPRNTGGAKTTKKFGSNRVQVTLRKLVMRVGMSTPCTFQVMTSPSFTSSSLAIPSSREISPVSRGILSELSLNHFPSTIVSLDAGLSR